MNSKPFSLFASTDNKIKNNRQSYYKSPSKRKSNEQRDVQIYLMLKESKQRQQQG
jgi:hypothetical protein